ncbi:MAG TPA: glycosyltransferase family 4 protein [Blastocatellia bacterium]|nr:glycosyltransferase family 4 protein [Blastocatellia bacterium]
MINCVLVGPPQEGGEGVYVKEVSENPPDGVNYWLSQQFHLGNERARCHPVQEVLLNRAVYPFLRYSFGFRVLSVGDDVDIVHVHSHPTKIYSKRRVPIVMSAGSSHYIYVRDYEKWNERKINRRYKLARSIYRPLGICDELLNVDSVTRIYTFSNWAREIYTRHGLPRNKVDVICPGFDVPALAWYKTPSERINFLFVGREFARKGGPLAVAAFERLRESNEKVSLTIVTRDREQVKQSDGITVLPFMSRERLYREIYPAADVFVMPTEAEGWGFTNAEAMSFALPVISTNISAIPEIVEHNVTGLLIEPGDGDALFIAMRRLAESNDMREEMGRRGRERFIANFSRDVFRHRLREFYQAALRN